MYTQEKNLWFCMLLTTMAPESWSKMSPCSRGPLTLILKRMLIPVLVEAKGG